MPVRREEKVLGQHCGLQARFDLGADFHSGHRQSLGVVPVPPLGNAGERTPLSNAKPSTVVPSEWPTDLLARRSGGDCVRQAKEKN